MSSHIRQVAALCRLVGAHGSVSERCDGSQRRARGTQRTRCPKTLGPWRRTIKTLFILYGGQYSKTTKV